MGHPSPIAHIVDGPVLQNHPTQRNTLSLSTFVSLKPVATYYLGETRESIQLVPMKVTGETLRLPQRLSQLNLYKKLLCINQRIFVLSIAVAETVCIVQHCRVLLVFAIFKVTLTFFFLFHFHCFFFLAGCLTLCAVSVLFGLNSRNENRSIVVGLWAGPDGTRGAV